MDVSIIIVNWNTKDLLCKCLKSIYEQSSEIDFEVIVVDNASTDDSREMVKKEFSQAILFENSKNKGFAAASNQAIAIAKGCYVLLLNSDTVVLDSAIPKTLAFADAHPEAAIVGCRVLNPDKSWQPSCFMFPSILNMLLSSTYLNKLFPQSRFFGRERMTWSNGDDVQEVDVVAGCFMLVRREAIEQVGLLDEQFFMYGEETDWCYRFHKAGWKILFTPCAEIVHLHGASSEQRKNEMTLQVRGSILLFLKKHRGRSVHAMACLLVAIFFLLRVPYWLGMAIISGNGRDGHLRIARIYIVGAVKALMGGRSLCVEE